MAVRYGDRFIHTTIHDFKGNISKYIRVLQQGAFEGVIVNRYQEPMGVFMLLPEQKLKKPKTQEDHLVDLLEKLSE